MKSIPDKQYITQEVIKPVRRFFKRFSVGKALTRANAYKNKGFTPVSILQYIVQLVFTHASMYRDSLGGDKSTIKGSKDTVYRFLRSSFINWTTFLFSVAASVCEWVDSLTSDERLTALVIDDTVFHRPFSKKLELVSRVFDHTDRKYKRGFRSLFLGWTDGATFLPLAFRHLSSSEKKNRYNEGRKADSRTCGGKAKREATMKSTEVALRMLADAKKFCIKAKHVLFDSWFTHPTFVMNIHKIGFHSVGRLKNSKTRYWLGDQPFTLKQLYACHKKRRGRSKYLLSVVVAIKNCDGETMDARIVFVRDINNRKNWIAFLSTDTELSEEQIIELYGKRWSIEVFFKTCKSYLKFTGEYQQLSYEAVTAHTAIVAVRYMIFAIEQRENTDMRRTPGDLFFLFADEAKDIQFVEVMSILISGLTKLISGITRLEEKEVIKLMDKFLDTMPSIIRDLAVRPMAT
jgi:hypothetical protein